MCVGLKDWAVGPGNHTRVSLSILDHIGVSSSMLGNEPHDLTVFCLTVDGVGRSYQSIFIHIKQLLVLFHAFLLPLP